MMREYGEDLTVERQKRQPFGFKADRIHRRMLVDGTARPGGTANTFYILFDDELFNDVSPFCPYHINDNVILEIKFAGTKDVVISSDKVASYEISDLQSW